jgi:hypothetical protein
MNAAFKHLPLSKYTQHLRAERGFCASKKSAKPLTEIRSQNSGLNFVPKY